MISRLIKYLTILLLLLFPLGLIFRFKLFANVQVVPQDILALSIFALILIDYLKRKKRKMEFFFKAQVIFVAVGIVSLAINVFIFRDINLGSALLYIIRYLSYICLINVGTYFTDSKLVKRLVIWSGITFILFGFIQYYFYNSLSGMRYLGWDNHLYRLFSTFLDPNFAGVFYVFFLFMIFHFQVGKKLKDSYFYLLLIFFDFLAIMMTYSRTALISLIAGVFAYYVIKRRLKIFFVILTFLLVSLFMFSDTMVEGLNPFRTASSHDRIVSLVNVKDIIMKNPLNGVGFNAFRDAQLRYGFRNSIGASLSNADAGTDNSFLFAFAVTGIIGTIVFVFSYASLMKKLIMEKNTFSIYLFCGLVGLITGSMFLNVLFYTPILGYVLIAVSLRKKLY